MKLCLHSPIYLHKVVRQIYISDSEISFVLSVILSRGFMNKSRNSVLLRNDFRIIPLQQMRELNESWVGSEVLTAVTMKSAVLWSGTLCSPIYAHRRRRRITSSTACLLLPVWLTLQP